MKVTNSSYNITERLAGKRTMQIKRSSATKEAAVPAVPSSPRMVMTVEEMGKELGISRATAYELVQRPDFPSFSIGRRVLISRDGLLKWIEKQYLSKDQDLGQPVRV